MSVDLSAAPLLADSLEVSLDIWGDDGPRGRVDGSSASRLVVGIPSSVLGSDATYEIRLSKWPVMIDAWILSGGSLTPEEAARELAEPTVQDDYSEYGELSPSSNNLLLRASRAAGLDVERLYLRTASDALPIGDLDKRAKDIFDFSESAASSYHFPRPDERYWLVLNLRAAGISDNYSNTSDVPLVYGDFRVHLQLDRMFWGLPMSLLTALTMLLAVCILYFGLLRRYHLRIFSL